MKTGHKLFVASFMTIALVLPIHTFAEQDINVQVDGQNITFDTMPVMENERILVPIRGVFEKIGGQVTWNQEENKVMIDNDTMTIDLPVGKETAYLHRKYDFTGIPEEVKLDVPAKIINDRTYVPVRFVAESLGMDVSWDNSSDTVIVKKADTVTPVEKPVQYTEISSDDLKNNTDLTAWYEQNYKTRGIHFKTDGNITYILACGGEEPTGGYSIEISDVTMVSPGNLFVSAQVNSPNPDMMVTEALTYPHILIKTEEPNITNVQGDVADLKDTANGQENLKEQDQTIAVENVKSIELFDLQNKKIKTYTQQEYEKLVSAYNSSKITDTLYPMMLAGNKMVITLNDNSVISFTSYGSKTNVIASIDLKDKNISYHLVCPEIAQILLSTEQP